METHVEARSSASATGSEGISSETPQKPADILAVGEAEIFHQPCILSLDGGGVRGLSSLVILREIMEEVQRQAKLKEIARPCDYFDLIGGTSTGGLIAIMLGRLKMSIEECINQYMKLSKEVFNHDHTVFGVLPTGEKEYRFDSAILEQVIQGLMDKKLKDQNASMAETDDSNPKICRTFVVATSSAVAEGPLILFRSYDTHENNVSKCAIWKAAWATSAAPSFFDPVYINVPAPGAWYVDGGLRYNHPAQVALDEARQCWPQIKTFLRLSIGTGQQTNVEFVNIKDVQLPKETKASKSLFTKVMSKVPGRNVIINAPGAAKAMLHNGKACVELSMSSEPTHEALLTLANSKDAHYRFPYYRFNVENGMDSIGLEEWKGNVRISELTEQYMRKRERKMDKAACAGILINSAPIEHIRFRVSESQYFVVPDVYQRNPYFLGRTKLLHVLRGKLCTSQSQTYNHRVALFGLGGVGKTQVAVEYVFKYRSKYHSTFWISAATLADLQTGFQEIAEKTKCVTIHQKDAASTTKAVLRWLEQQTSWLLVLDNLDEISIVDGYLPEISSGNGHLLITTRNQDPTGIPAQGLEVEVFDSDDAIDLLLLRATGTKESQPETHSAGAEIVAELGYLPVAIEHAAAFIRQSLPDISKFLDMYSKSRKRFLERVPKQNYAYSRAVAATFLLSLDEVKKINPNAAELLTLLAFLNPDGILIDFLQAGRNGLDELLKTLVGDSFGFGAALADLGQYSLIRQTNADQTISVHRLVQAALRDNLDADRKTQFMEFTVSLFLSGFPHFQENKRELCRRYQAQVDRPLQTLFELRTENLAKISARFALFLEADGKASACESFERIAVDIRTNIFGAEHPDTLTSMSNLANTYQAQGRTAEAAALQEVLEKRRRILGAEHPDTLTSMNNLAIMYQAQGRTAEAAALQEEVLEKRSLERSIPSRRHR